MARKRHSPESIAKVLRQAESGVPIGELARKTGVHENTVHPRRAAKIAHLGALQNRTLPGGQFKIAHLM